MSVRRLARHLALDGLSLATRLSGQMGDFGDRPIVQLLLLHHIDPHEEQSFDALVRWMVEHYEVVSWSTATEKIRSGEVTRPTAAFSFDDGFKNNLNAAAIMGRYAVKGCFYVCPGIVGETDAAAIRKFSVERLLYNEAKRFMNWNELESLLDDGHEIGNHTQDHLYLMDLPKDQFIEQVVISRDTLMSRLGAGQHFSWPYGWFKHFRRDWVDTIFELGHVSCASGVRGAHLVAAREHTGDNFCLRRESLDVSWPLRHCQYFINKSSRLSVERSQSWINPR